MVTVVKLCDKATYRKKSLLRLTVSEGESMSIVMRSMAVSMHETLEQ